MVALTTLAAAALSAASGAALVGLLLAVRRVVRPLDDARPARYVAVAIGLVAWFALIRSLQPFLAGGGPEAIYYLRNVPWLAGAALVWRALLPSKDPWARSTAGLILAATAGVAAFVAPFRIPILAFALGAGFLGAALVTLRARASLAAGVGGPLLVGAYLLAAWPWADALVLRAAFQGDPGMFLVSRIGTDVVLLLAALLALPAARDAAWAAEPPARPDRATVEAPPDRPTEEADAAPAAPATEAAEEPAAGDENP